MIGQNDGMKILYSFSICYFVLSVYEIFMKIRGHAHCACDLKHEEGRIVHDVLYRALGRKQITYLPENKRLTNMVFNVFS